MTGAEFSRRLRRSLPLSIEDGASGRLTSWDGTSSAVTPAQGGHSLEAGLARPAANLEEDSSQPRPFPGESAEANEPIRTSDVWTDATIPHLR